MVLLAPQDWKYTVLTRVNTALEGVPCTLAFRICRVYTFYKAEIIVSVFALVTRLTIASTSPVLLLSRLPHFRSAVLELKYAGRKSNLWATNKNGQRYMSSFVALFVMNAKK
jgi:hypothetical protein